MIQLLEINKQHYVNIGDGYLYSLEIHGTETRCHVNIVTTHGVHTYGYYNSREGEYRNAFSKAEEALDHLAGEIMLKQAAYQEVNAG